jgi:hypothetical protein
LICTRDAGAMMFMLRSRLLKSFHLQIVKNKIGTFESKSKFSGRANMYSPDKLP